MSALLVGHAREVITPQVPLSLAGYFNIRMWTEVLDDLLVQAVALKQEDQAAVLIQFDLLGVSNEYMRRIREACRDIPCLAPENILFTGSHTHTAPDIHSHRKGGNRTYNDAAIASAAKAVHDAFSDLAATTTWLGRARDERFAFNRRYWMKSGNVITNPPRRDPEIERPEGPTDPTIELLEFRTADQRRILLTNIVNHADTTEGCKVSADWPGWLRRALEQALPNTVVLPVIGTAGNINHFDPNGPAEQSGPNITERIGRGYAESVLAALPNMHRNDGDDLRTAATTFTTGPREVDEAELAQARQHAAKYAFDGQTTLTSEDLATESPAALKYFADSLISVAEDRSEKRFEVGALMVGQAIIVMLPGEPFVEIGLALKEHTGERPTLAAALNQDCAYIPNHFNYGRGGYETTARCSPYSIKTGDHLLSAAKALLTDLIGTPPR